MMYFGGAHGTLTLPKFDAHRLAVSSAREFLAVGDGVLLVEKYHNGKNLTKSLGTVPARTTSQF
jgi:hypothetical protein